MTGTLRAACGIGPTNGEAPGIEQLITPEKIVNDLHTRGFLSTELDLQRQLAREQFTSGFVECDTWSDQAMTSLRGIDLSNKSASIQLAAAYWMRCVRSCQGGILLAERGMLPEALTLVRSAVESLFHAVALTANPKLVDRLSEHDLAERKKQARGMLSIPSIVQTLAPADRDRIEALLQSKPANPRPFSAYDAAKAAGLLSLYETMFRGFSLGAAHSTLTALDHEFSQTVEGEIIADFGPSFEQLPWVLGMVSECLKIGVARLENAF